VPDGTAIYIWLTKDRGEAPERGKVEYLPTPPLDEKLSKAKKDDRIYVHARESLKKVTPIEFPENRNEYIFGAGQMGCPFVATISLSFSESFPCPSKIFHPIPMVTFQLAASCCASGRLEFMGA
jgi:hypothetical protein